MKGNTRRIAMPLLFVLWPSFAIAHHSAVVHYDLSAEIVHRDISLLEWRFFSPHSEFVFEAPDAEGNLVEWTAVTFSASMLGRFGYTADSFQAGQILTIRGAPGRNRQPTMNVTEVVIADGTVTDFKGAFGTEGDVASFVDGPEESVEESSGHLTGLWAWVRAPLSPEDRTRAPEGAVLVDSYGQAEEMPIGESGIYPLTERGLEFQANWAPDYESCRPFSAWLGATAPHPIEFDEPMAGRLHIRLLYMDQERTVWLDGRDHPALEAFPRTLQGHSVGHWEGDTLVIETVHMLSNAITRNGIHHSDSAVLTERISREGDTLFIVRVLEDPEHLSRPIAEVIKRPLIPGGKLRAYGACER